VEKPSQLMREWHPDLFPDSMTVAAEVLTKGFLEYHLETLTSRKQEQLFEDFCRRLVEVEICPNIKPQTGPTGGGDSKVDASTYPIAPVLAERYYWGNPNPPTDESWGFAFSCKKKWKQKIKDDAAKIKDVGRSFSQVFFITSQFVRDKDRATLENELTAQHAFQAHILDKQWVVEKVITRKHHRMAIAKLGIDIAQPEEARLGPRDTERQQELEAILARIGGLPEYPANTFTIAQDYLRAALLARGLGQSRYEIDGFFMQARRIAANARNHSLLLRCGYHHAWTTFWWFDDLPEFDQIYSQIEHLIADTDDVEDCELLVGLWSLRAGAAIRQRTTSADPLLLSRSATIKLELERLAAESHRPNSSLQARSLILMTRTFEERDSERALRSILVEMTECLDRSVGLGTFPALHFINRFQLLGNSLGHLPEYDALFEKMRVISRERSGDTSEGRLLFERGMQQLRADSVRDALKNLGQARRRLFRDETLQAAARASWGCSQAYIAMNLYWAARMEALAAAHISCHRDAGEYLCPREAFVSLVTLARLDLGLGRLAAFLAWYEAAAAMLAYLANRHHNVETFAAELGTLDALLAIRINHLAGNDIEKLAPLIESLDALNLGMARWVLLFRFGKLDVLHEEFEATTFDKPVTVEAFFKQFQALQLDDAVRPLSGLAGESYVTYSTRVMGVDYRIRCRNEFSTVVLAENLLGIIEAALALAHWENLAFIVDHFEILLDVDDSEGQTPPTFRFFERGDESGHRLIWKADMLEWLSRAPRNDVVNHLQEFLLHLLFAVTIDPDEDLEEELARWHSEETFSRAITLSPICIIIADLVGDTHYGLDYWRNPTLASQV